MSRNAKPLRLRCSVCRRKWEPPRRDALYCSGACRQKAYRRRRTTTRHGFVHYSSASDQWATPQDLFDSLDAEFGFTLDVCASVDNAKCARFYSEQDDGLAQSWEGVCWMNPPYGREIGRWMAKAKAAAAVGATVVCLVPARTDTSWWWDNCGDQEIRFLRGRLKFGKSQNAAPFPSAVVILRPPQRMVAIVSNEEAA